MTETPTNSWIHFIIFILKNVDKSLGHEWTEIQMVVQNYGLTIYSNLTNLE